MYDQELWDFTFYCNLGWCSKLGNDICGCVKGDCVCLIIIIIIIIGGVLTLGHFNNHLQGV